jgi:poly(A) polymerase
LSNDTQSAPNGRPEIPEELLDPDAVKTVRRLRRAGHEAYLVGGCVRDLLLGLRPKDFDIATSAHPQQVKDTFRNCRLIGRRFRLAHVFFKGGKIVEVSTFRANPLDELTDLPKDLLIRHDNVFGNAEEDARRRDFTVNGLFYDLDTGRVVDHVNGMADLKQRRIRTIGNPDVRMREDPVRILRAIRFAAKCSCDLEPATLAAMKQHVHEIPRCAPPRSSAPA